MTAFTRRIFARNALLTCACGAINVVASDYSVSARAVNDIQGCILRAGDTRILGLTDDDFGALSGDRLANTTGNPSLDRALGRALVRMSQTFRVNPSFAFFADEGAPNAYATPETMLPNTWGALVFGRSLFADQFQRYQDKGVSIVAITAHEFAHICQYRRNMMSTLRGSDRTVRRVELHADFLSGWYLGLRKKQDPSISLWSSGDTFHRIGDTEYNNVQHHGTPQERVEASQHGFELGGQGDGDVELAIEQGASYVLSLSHF